jgi:hypothetical protein
MRITVTSRPPGRAPNSQMLVELYRHRTTGFRSPDRSSILDFRQCARRQDRPQRRSHRLCVGECGDRNAVCVNGFAEGPQDNGAGDAVGGDRDRVTGVIIEPRVAPAGHYAGTSTIPSRKLSPRGLLVALSK